MPNKSADCISRPSTPLITANTDPTAVQQGGSGQGKSSDSMIMVVDDDDHITNCPKSKLLCLVPACMYFFETSHKHSH